MRKAQGDNKACVFGVPGEGCSCASDPRLQIAPRHSAQRHDLPDPLGRAEAHRSSAAYPKRDHTAAKGGCARAGAGWGGLCPCPCRRRRHPCPSEAPGTPWRCGQSRRNCSTPVPGPTMSGLNCERTGCSGEGEKGWQTGYIPTRANWIGYDVLPGTAPVGQSMRRSPGASDRQETKES